MIVAVFFRRRVGNCLLGNTTNPSVRFDGSFNFQMDWEISFFIKTPSVLSNVAYFLEFGHNTTITSGLHIRHYGSSLNLTFGSGTFNSTQSANGILEPNKEYFLTYKRVAGTLSIECNGVQVASGYFSQSINYGHSRNYIFTGYDNTIVGGLNFYGQIYGLKAKINGVLVLDMPISEGTGTTINSKVGGYTGTMNNFDPATCWQKQNKFLFP